MRKEFEIGPGLSCDVDRLVASRLLVQANSGGGKTRTLRRLLEQSHGRLQHLVIDPEGEYHTLREKFDYVLAAPSGGDTVAHPRTAAMLAERLLQLNVSAILDIYELNPDQRVLFVQRFLDALVNAPRNLWHSVLVVLDEAHVYAPEGSQSGSSTAVKALASRGRKRGFCLVPATQRLSKLSKDVAAECNNKLVGRCTLDVDIKRAAEELGFTTNEQKQCLRQLEPGQFYAYGPAFDVKAPILVHVGAVKTSHPEPGQKAAPVPAPTDKVRKVLQQLADLPAEAEEREKTVAELRKDLTDKDRRIKELERATSVFTHSKEFTKQEVKQVAALTDADRALIEKLRSDLQTATSKASSSVADAGTALEVQLRTAAVAYVDDCNKAGELCGKRIAEVLDKASVKKLLEKLNGLANEPQTERKQVLPNGARWADQRTPAVPSTRPPTVAHEGITPVEQRVLDALAELAVLGVPEPERIQVAFLANYSNLKSTGFQRATSGLSTKGLIGYPSSTTMTLTTDGRTMANKPEKPRTPEEIQQRVVALLPPVCGRVLQPLLNAYPKPMNRMDLAAAANYTNLKSTGFQRAVSQLSSLGFIRYPDSSSAVASPVLFLETE